MSTKTWLTAATVIGLVGVSASCATSGPSGLGAPVAPAPEAREPAPLIPGDTLVTGELGMVSLDEVWANLPPRLTEAEGAHQLVEVPPEQVVDDQRYSVLARTSSPQANQARPVPASKPKSKPNRGGSWSPGGSNPPPRGEKPDKSRGGSWTPPRNHWTPKPHPTWHSSSRPSWRPSHRPSHRWDRDRHRNYWRTRYKYKPGSIYYFPYGRYYYPYYFANDSYYPYGYDDYPFLYYSNGSYYPYGSQGQLEQGTAVQDATVVIYENRYQPERVFLKPGGTVRWINMDRVDHTATPRTATNFVETGDIGPGATSAPATILGHGEIRYFCEFHPEMRGTIIVE